MREPRFAAKSNQKITLPGQTPCLAGACSHAAAGRFPVSHDALIPPLPGLHQKVVLGGLAFGLGVFGVFPRGFHLAPCFLRVGFVPVGDPLPSRDDGVDAQVQSFGTLDTSNIPLPVIAEEVAEIAGADVAPGESRHGG